MLCSTAGLLLHSHREGPQMCLVALPWDPLGSKFEVNLSVRGRYYSERSNSNLADKKQNMNGIIADRLRLLLSFDLLK